MDVGSGGLPFKVVVFGWTHLDGYGGARWNLIVPSVCFLGGILCKCVCVGKLCCFGLFYFDQHEYFPVL